MNIHANIPVLYLDTYKVRIECTRRQMILRSSDNLPIEDSGVLIILGKLSGMCQSIRHAGIVFGKNWVKISKNKYTLELSDIDEEDIRGNYTLNVSTKRPMVSIMF